MPGKGSSEDVQPFYPDEEHWVTKAAFDEALRLLRLSARTHLTEVNNFLALYDAPQVPFGGTK